MDHIMTYEEYLRDVKKGIVTDLGNSPVTPLLLMLQGKWKTQITMTIWFVYMLRPRFPLFYIGAKLQKSIFLTIMMMATYI